jgi:hypothetical protein
MPFTVKCPKIFPFVFEWWPQPPKPSVFLDLNTKVEVNEASGKRQVDSKQKKL